MTQITIEHQAIYNHIRSHGVSFPTDITGEEDWDLTHQLALLHSPHITDYTPKHHPTNPIIYTMIVIYIFSIITLGFPILSIFAIYHYLKHLH